MVEYKCKTCKSTFDRKSSYVDHMSRKIKCSSGKYIPKKMKHQCEYCEKSYSRKDSLNRHLRVCQNIITNHTVILKGNNNINCSNHITHNGDVNNNFTINIFPFGEDGVESLTIEDKLDILLSNQGLIIEIICKVNFDPDKPSHHNMYISDIKSPYGVVYNGEKWSTVRYPNIVHTLVEAKKVDLEKILEEMKEYLNDDIVNGVRTALSKFNLCDHKFFKQIMIHIKPILYDNRELVMNTRYKQKHLDNVSDVQKNEKYKNALKDGITLSDIDKQLKEKNKLNRICSNLKAEINYLCNLLQKTNSIDQQTLDIINKQIYESTEPSFLKSIIRAVTKGLFGQKTIDHAYIMKYVESDREFSKYL